MIFNVNAELVYSVNERSTFFLNIAVANHRNQQLSTENIQVSRADSVDEFITDDLGNHFHRFVVPEGRLKVEYKARTSVSYKTVEPKSIASTQPEDLPLSKLRYIVPSRYCQSDQLQRLAYREFASVHQGYPQVEAICEWIHSNVDYLGQTTDSLTTAVDTVTQRVGVCRDFAHLGVTFCRALNIPARFLSGYALDLEPPDFHAVFEAWLDGNWYIFDPSQRITRGGFIRIGTGRDASDVPFANIIGAASMEDISVSCELSREGNENNKPEETDQALQVG